MVHESAVLFCEFAITILSGVLVGAAALQISCALYNRLAGFAWKPAGTNATILSVPGPDYPRAVRIVFFATLINVPLTLIIFQLMRLAEEVIKVDDHGLLALTWVAVPMGILVLAGLNSAILPTSFGKGLMISLFSHLLAALLACVIVLILWTFALEQFILFPL